MSLLWKHDQTDIDWEALSHLYKIAPLGNKPACDLEEVFNHSMFKCFVFDGMQVVGVGRALADGIDCSYICDVAVHPEYQGMGLGKQIMNRLAEMSKGHKKIILYANPGKEGFYQKLGFKRMKTAMAIFKNPEHALDVGLVADD